MDFKTITVDNFLDIDFEDDFTAKSQVLNTLLVKGTLRDKFTSQQPFLKLGGFTGDLFANQTNSETGSYLWFLLKKINTNNINEIYSLINSLLSNLVEEGIIQDFNIDNFNFNANLRILQLKISFVSNNQKENINIAI